VALACAAIVTFESPVALLVALTDGAVALGIVLAGSAAGLWLVWATGNGDLPVRWQLALGAGFGLGLLSLSVLWAGLAGQLGRSTWLTVMALLGVAGLGAVYILLRCCRGESRASAAETAEGPAASQADPSAGAWRWVWLLAVPAIALAVLVATVPPGFLWAEEANGYDVLEYHLGVPKEYFVAGRITYLDHNMYANFPMNAEMLYLLCMLLYGQPWSAALTAKFVNLLLGALAVFAAWLIGRDFSPKAGVVTGIAAAAFPWTVYLSGLAYVENGMLFYGLLAAGLCSRAIRMPQECNSPRGLAIGAMLGFACGYKYTAVAMIALPILLAWAGLCLRKPNRSVSRALTAVVLAATAFAPWAAKNWRMTGDPVFPLGHRVFGSTVWTDAEYQKFETGHSPVERETGLANRLALLWRRVLAEPRFAYVPWLVAAGAVFVAICKRTAYRKGIWIWAGVLAAQIAIWLFATHLFARFAVVMWIALVPMVGVAAAWTTQGPRGVRIANLAVLSVYVLVGQAWLWNLYRRHVHAGGRFVPVHGHVDWFLGGQWPGFEHLQTINGDLPADAKVLMVADARGYYVARQCDYWVVFSRNRFAEAIRGNDGAAERILDWIRSQGYDYVWVDFAEMHRLSRTYGLDEQITPELFRRLEAAGLRRVRDVRLAGRGPVYGILYEVPQK